MLLYVTYPPVETTDRSFLYILSSISPASFGALRGRFEAKPFQLLLEPLLKHGQIAEHRFCGNGKDRQKHDTFSGHPCQCKQLRHNKACRQESDHTADPDGDPQIIKGTADPGTGA